MLTFSVQQKILGEILRNPSNAVCADCNSKSPTWASLDFGVFLCSNCAGAHRALGPTITRVRSTKLDNWNKAWVENVRIGNKQINTYWEFENSYALSKPKPGASLQQINRYVQMKYIKKKFATDGKHPLKAYQDGEYEIAPRQVPSTISTAVKKDTSPTTKTNSKEISSIEKPKLSTAVEQPTTKARKVSHNLLDEVLIDSASNNNTQQNQQPQNNNGSIGTTADDDDDQFTQYTSGNHAPLSYEELMKKHSSSSSTTSTTIPNSHMQQNQQFNNGMHPVMVMPSIHHQPQPNLVGGCANGNGIYYPQPQYQSVAINSNGNGYPNQQQILFQQHQPQQTLNGQFLPKQSANSQLPTNWTL